MKKARVRFAPSPTGPLHIGGVRTALYNYLFAKKFGGTFILRIEDTDQGRYVPGAEDYIIEALKWCGLVPEEGPGIGGPHAPYRQSERKGIYQKYAAELVANGGAYYAFDTPEELDEQRNQGDENFKYGCTTRLHLKNSLTLPEAEVQRRIAAGDDYVIRLKVPENEEVTFDDLIRGEVSFQTNGLDDKVLLKSDGMPTYHLANIVDDHLMEITHVIRGEEWLPSTGHHVLLYRAFGWQDTMPQFAHLPLILKPSPESYVNKTSLEPLAERLKDEFFKKYPDQPASFEGKAKAFVQLVLQDKKNITAQLKESDKDPVERALLKEFLKSSMFGKLSKRDGDRLGFPVFPLTWQPEGSDSSFLGFREAGFLPEAMINFLAFVGWNPGTEQEIFSMAELCEAFSIEKISKSGARFDYDKAKWYNHQYLGAASGETLAKMLRPDVEAAGYSPSDGYLSAVCNLMKHRMTLTSEFVPSAYFFFGDIQSFDNQNITKRWNADSRPNYEAIASIVAQSESMEAAGLEAAVKNFIEEKNLKMGEVLPLLRIALTGTMQGAGVFEIMETMGREMSLKRLAAAWGYFDSIC